MKKCKLRSERRKMGGRCRVLEILDYVITSPFGSDAVVKEHDNFIR